MYSVIKQKYVSHDQAWQATLTMSLRNKKTCEQAQALTQELSCANHNSERQLKTHFQRTLDVQIHKTGSTKTWLGESEFSR